MYKYFREKTTSEKKPNKAKNTSNICRVTIEPAPSEEISIAQFHGSWMKNKNCALQTLFSCVLLWIVIIELFTSRARVHRDELWSSELLSSHHHSTNRFFRLSYACPFKSPYTTTRLKKTFTIQYFSPKINIKYKIVFHQRNNETHNRKKFPKKALSKRDNKLFFLPISCELFVIRLMLLFFLCRVLSRRQRNALIHNTN